MTKEFWNQRYAEQEYAYGTEPNAWLKQCLMQLEPGSMLVPADGEGRNGVFAAQQGWQVTAFDISEEGRKKALLLAEKRGVSIQYDLCDMEAVDYPDAAFDALVLIFAHFPAAKRKDWHKRLSRMIKPGGYLIMEAFHPNHQQYQQANPAAGGPKDPTMLYTTTMVADDFPDWHFEVLREEEVSLEEGPYHAGKAAVVRVLARKK
jgi:cyclopropane fatty-acyl-phospholipid synthase-like methyltransferase